MRLLSFHVQFLQLWLIYRCWVQFCTKKLENTRRKLLKLGNKHSAFDSHRGYIYPGQKFDRGRFLSHARQPLLSHERALRNEQINAMNCNFRQASSKHLNFSLSLKPTFSSQNHYQKFSRLTACLGPCPWLAPQARKGRKLPARRENLLVPDDRTGFFLEPCPMVHGVRQNGQATIRKC